MLTEIEALALTLTIEELEDLVFCAHCCVDVDRCTSCASEIPKLEAALELAQLFARTPARRRLEEQWLTCAADPRRA